MLFLNSSFLAVVYILTTATLMEVFGFDGETRLLGQWKILVYSQRAFSCRNLFSYDPIGALYTLQILDNGRFILFPEKFSPCLVRDETACNLVECTKRQRMDVNTIHGSWRLRYEDLCFVMWCQWMLKYHTIEILEQWSTFRLRYTLSISCFP